MKQRTRGTKSKKKNSFYRHDFRDWVRAEQVRCPLLSHAYRSLNTTRLLQIIGRHCNKHCGNQYTYKNNWAVAQGDHALTFPGPTELRVGGGKAGAENRHIRRSKISFSGIRNQIPTFWAPSAKSLLRGRSLRRRQMKVKNNLDLITRPMLKLNP